jgi:hypothetical protein
MDARASALAGDWDVYAAGMHSELHLDASGNYVHSLWGVRKHWGTWSLEDQNGFTYLVMQLADALPRMAAGFLGWQQVAWPTYEAWPILRNNGDNVTLQNAWMQRRVAAAPAVPAYVSATPPAPLPIAAVPPPPPIAFPAPPPMMFPTPPAPLPLSTDPTRPVPSQSVLDQWTNEHADWDKVRETIAKTIQTDNETTRRINDMYAAQNAAQFDSNQQNIQKTNEIIQKGTDHFIDWLRTGRAD